MWTAEFDRFVAPARARPQIWRVILGFLMIASGYIGAFLLLLGGMIGLLGLNGAMEYLGMLTVGGSPTLVVLMLGMFAGPFLMTLVAARQLHDRPGRSLLGPGLIHGFAVGATIAAVVFTVATLFLPLPFELVPNTPVGLFLTFLPVALLALLIQTGAEEIAFRGYLQQQLAARFATPLAWMVVPSILFGLLHVDPGAGWAGAWTALPPTLFGFVAADLTRVTGSIGAAWGLHFLNNASAILVVSLAGNLSGLSLWTTPFGAEDLSISSPLVWQEMMVTIIVWACIRLWLARGGRGQAASSA